VQVTQAISLFAPLSVYSHFSQARGGGIDPQDPTSGYLPEPPMQIAPGTAMTADYEYAAVAPSNPSYVACYYFDYIVHTVVSQEAPFGSSATSVPDLTPAVKVQVAAIDSSQVQAGGGGGSVTVYGGGMLSVTYITVNEQLGAGSGEAVIYPQNFLANTNAHLGFDLPTWVVSGTVGFALNYPGGYVVETVTVP
jgi:hypothetical protein